MKNQSRFLAPEKLSQITHQPHFIYVAEFVEDTSEVKAAKKTLIRHLERHIKDCGISPLQIDVMTRSNIQEGNNPKVLKAFDTLNKHLGFNNAALVYCQAAAIHNDPDFVNVSFVSHVLCTSTGRKQNPYLINTISEVDRKNDTKTSSLAVTPGDTFVFDPGTAHCAFPLYPSSTSILILMQEEVPDANEADRLAIMDRFEPRACALTANDYL